MLLMKILVLCDDYYHPAEIVRKGLSWLDKEGLELTFLEDATDFSSDILQTYPVVIFSKSNNISSENREQWMNAHQQDFVDYVQRGGGLVVIHSGTAGYKDASLFRTLMGGYFLRHPEQCAVTIEAVNHNLICSKSENFTVLDEHYFMEIEASDLEIVFITSSEYGTQPGGFIRKQGEGQVCVLTPGHNLEVWQQDGYKKIIYNAIKWCGNISWEK